MWYVVETAPSSELRVAADLMFAGLPAFCPMERRASFVRHRRVERVSPLIARILFVAGSPRIDAVTWHLICDRTQVRRLFGGEEPAPVLGRDLAVLELWRFSADAEGVVRIGEVEGRLADMRRGYVVGDVVVIRDGLWAGFSGECAWIDEKNGAVGVNSAGFGRRIGIKAAIGSCELVSKGGLRPEDGGPSRPARSHKRGGKSVRTRSFARRELLYVEI